MQVKFEPPLLLKQSLREYQRVGVGWLTAMHQTGVGCILADADGLGNKVQTIAFLAQLGESLGKWGPHLLIVPQCHLVKWKTEFDSWFPSCRTFVYFGDAAKRKSLRKVFLLLHAYCCQSASLAELFELSYLHEI